MLLNLTELIQKHSLKITGVIHIGAHWGEEVVEYYRNKINNIILFEPCSDAFARLKNLYGRDKNIRLFNYACAAVDGEADMYTETANKGQSNSLLQPARHLQHYPDIKFTGIEKVNVRRLDSFVFEDINYFNMINMDVQGAEGAVLIGGKKTLEWIDYVYTEVNDDAAQLYKNATRVSDLDELLKDFYRVETQWTAQGWGDALYIRRSKMNNHV